MSDVLLVNPPMGSPEAHRSFDGLCPPLGLAYVAACLVGAGVDVLIVDLALEANPEQALRYALREARPFMVGITALTQNSSRALDVAAAVRRVNGSAFVVMGGPHVTYEWRATLATRLVDVVVRFEGERTIVDLFVERSQKDAGLDQIDGIAFWDGTRFVATKARPSEEDLDHLPFPARWLLPMDRYGRPGTLVTSRGCPYKCIFCLASAFEGTYRRRSADSVLREIRELRTVYGVSDLFFLDNVFTVDAARVLEICRGIIREGLGIRFRCVSRIDLLTEEVVAALSSAGCDAIEIGVESADQGSVEAMGKHIAVEAVPEAADLVLDAGMQPMFTFQVGSPFDTAVTVDQTHALAKKLREKGATTFFSVMTPFPGTALANRTRDFGLSIHAREWSEYRTSNPICDTRSLSRSDLRRALYREAVVSGGHASR